jgi:hypothetical protein
VQLTQPRRSSSSSSGQSTALLLVLDSWGRLEHQLRLYSANLLMLWFYACMHGYGLHIYVHGAELPPWMPVYFIKPAGLLHAMTGLGYSHVMYVDWDMLLSPHTAPPLSLFYGEYPAASLLLQGEYNFCAGANLWRNTPEGKAFLQAWWDMGARGCCATTQHDQSALKHLVAAYLANFTGQPALYGPRQQRHFRLPASLPPPAPTNPGQHKPYAVHSTESPPTPVSTWLRLRPVLQDRGSAIGLVGLDVHYHRWVCVAAIQPQCRAPIPAGARMAVCVCYYLFLTQCYGIDAICAAAADDDGSHVQRHGPSHNQARPPQLHGRLVGLCAT